MRRKRDQAAISPSLAFSEFVRGQAFAPLGLDFVHDRPAPIDAPLRRREDAGVDALIAVGIVAHAGGRVEVDGLERPHEGPAQCEALTNPDIDVLNPRIALLDEPEGFFKQRPLQPVHDKAVELSLHDDRRMTGGTQKTCRALDKDRVRPGRRDHFGGGNKIGRIDGMDDEAARAALEVFGKGRGQNRGGRARQHSVGRRGRVEPREHRTLHLDILRRVLLDVDRSFKRRLECCRRYGSARRLRWPRPRSEDRWPQAPARDARYRPEPWPAPPCPDPR